MVGARVMTVRRDAMLVVGVSLLQYVVRLMADGNVCAKQVKKLMSLPSPSRRIFTDGTLVPFYGKEFC